MATRLLNRICPPIVREWCVGDAVLCSTLGEFDYSDHESWKKLKPYPVERVLAGYWIFQRVRDDGTIETDRDVLDWLKYAQSETTGIKLGFSKGEVAELDAQIDAAWRESVEAEVNRRLAERGLTLEVQQANVASDRSAMLKNSLIGTPGINR